MRATWPWRALAAMVLLTAACVHAYERDVHDGLTRWLALQAGFDATQADAIAIGNARVDGGLLDTQTLTPELACIAHDLAVAREAQQRHFPAAVPVPSPPAQRAVVAGGAAARAALSALTARLKVGQADVMLMKLGEALHPLQDSWAHQGVPAVPSPFIFAGLACDAALAAAAPMPPGATHPHGADLTHLQPAAALAMAQATYDTLLAYPPIAGRTRTAAPWSVLQPQVQAFVQAPTKALKRRWFKSHGVDDTGFLQGISLPDGDAAPPDTWQGDKLPALAAGTSMQHEVPQPLRDFFDALLRRWLSDEPADRVLAEAAGLADAGPRASAPTREIAARLALWKLADHGRAAALAHAPQPLNTAQLKQVASWAHAPQASIVTDTPQGAVMPLQAVGPRATPLLPYLVHLDPARPERAVALLRLRHAPYDTLAWVAERRENRWTLTAVQAWVEP